MKETRVACDTQAYSALLRTCAQATGGEWTFGPLSLRCASRLTHLLPLVHLLTQQCPRLVVGEAAYFHHQALSFPHCHVSSPFFAGSGGLEEGIAALHALRGMGVKPDAACYNTLIGSCAAVALGSDGLSLACEVLMSMRNASTSVKLLHSDVNELVLAAAAAGGGGGAVARGAKLLDEMVQEGWAPDSITCNALLEACADMSSARGLLSQG